VIKDNILVVDDEESIRRLFESFFNQTNYNIDALENAESALELLRQNHYQLIFIDIDLPGMNGMELCKSIRRNNPISTIVVQ